MKNYLFALLLLGGAFMTITSCDDDDPVTPTVESIAKIVQNNTNFTSLLAALNRANLASVLDGTDKFTVFAPENAAFSAFLSAKGFASVDDVPVETLSQILLNHVVSGEVRSSALTAGYVPSLATESSTGNNLSLYIDLSNGVKINDQSTVTTADVSASNGVIHIVSDVIDLPTVVTFATSNPIFSTLVSALTRPSFGSTYTDLLSGSTSAPFTVFAPTNAAFDNLLTFLGAGSLADIDDATLQSVLNYHVIAGGNVLASALTNGGTATTFQGEDISFDLSSGSQIIDGSSMPANIIVTDVQSTNGVVHAIDKVILPKAVWDAVNPTIAGFVSMNPDYSSLLAAVVKSGLADVLSSDDSNLTVLAPNNASFDKFLSDNNFASLDAVPVDLLKQVILNHVISGEVFSSALTTSYNNTLATNADDDALSIYINTENGVSFNGGATNNGATVVTADIDVRNGVIHAVDNVIGLPTVVNFAIGDNTFGTLVAALTRADLTFDFVGTLNLITTPAPYTVFAPTNDAFGNLLTELNASALGDIDAATLDAVLRYHVLVESNIRADDLTDGIEVETFGGGKFAINLPAGAAPNIKDSKDRVTNIIVTDVQAWNGVIHVVDKVLLP